VPRPLICKVRIPTLDAQADQSQVSSECKVGNPTLQFVLQEAPDCETSLIVVEASE